MAVTEHVIWECDLCGVKSEPGWFHPVGWYLIGETDRGCGRFQDRQVCGECFVRAFGRDAVEKMKRLSEDGQ